MKKLFITAIMICASTIGFAQQKQNKSEKIKINAPVTQKSSDTLTKAVVKFKPPVIVKDAPAKKVKAKNKERVKFTPPVIVKD